MQLHLQLSSFFLVSKCLRSIKVLQPIKLCYVLSQCVYLSVGIDGMFISLYWMIHLLTSVIWLFFAIRSSIIIADCEELPLKVLDNVMDFDIQFFYILMFDIQHYAFLSSLTWPLLPLFALMMSDWIALKRSQLDLQTQISIMTVENCPSYSLIEHWFHLTPPRSELLYVEIHSRVDIIFIYTTHDRASFAHRHLTRYAFSLAILESLIYNVDQSNMYCIAFSYSESWSLLSRAILPLERTTLWSGINLHVTDEDTDNFSSSKMCATNHKTNHLV